MSCCQELARGARERVAAFVGTTDEALARTGASGSFRHIRVTVPASALPGATWISAKGRRTRLFAQAEFTVELPHRAHHRVIPAVANGLV